MIGSARRPTAPKLEALDAGLHLLVATGGGDPAIKQQLLDLKAAVVHNTKIAAEVDKEIAELNGLECREASVDKRAHDVEVRLAKLATATAANKALIAEANERIRRAGDLESSRDPHPGRLLPGGEETAVLGGGVQYQRDGRERLVVARSVGHGVRGWRAGLLGRRR